MRKRAAKDFTDQHVGEINVRDELRIAGDFVEPFDSLNALADDGELFCFRHNQYSLRFLIETIDQFTRAKAAKENPFYNVSELGVFCALRASHFCSPILKR